MYLIYSFFLLIALCIYFPLYLVRLRISKNESLHISERLGARIPLGKKDGKSLWIHAVSVGEVMSLQNLIKEIKQNHPDWNVYFSTLTNSGFEVAKKKLKNIDELFYLPFDFKFIVRRFFKNIRPSLLILTESEFWPHLIREARRFTDGVILVNGRISSSSYKRYRFLRVFTKRILDNIDLFLVQTEQDQKRLEKMGAIPERIKVAGNLKAEINLKEMSEKDLSNMKKELNLSDRYKTVVAGSTRKGEDKILLKAFSKALSERKDIRFIIAPRHMNRVSEIMNCCETLRLKAVKKTFLYKEKEWEVLILDTIGELARIYAVADCAFIGGSLIPWGGQNLLEPAFYQKPIFFGPHMDNFAYFAHVFVESGGAKTVKSEKELINIFIFKDENRLYDMGKKAKQTLNSLQGATRETLQAVESRMP
jgi:3-deoxy-D-manno-octulosonic-acid transferase